MAKNKPVTIVGGGLAGSECAYQLAKRGIPVVLYEMRPKKMTPAHQTGDLAELVCSNSFKADTLDTASGVLKAEMRRLDSLILRAADLYRVPAGKALAVDRRLFAQEVTRTLEQHPNITIRREEVTEIPRDGITVLATGPLTSEALTKQLRELLGMNFLYFFDAIAPSVGKGLRGPGALFSGVPLRARRGLHQLPDGRGNLLPLRGRPGERRSDPAS